MNDERRSRCPSCNYDHVLEGKGMFCRVEVYDQMLRTALVQRASLLLVGFLSEEQDVRRIEIRTQKIQDAALRAERAISTGVKLLERLQREKNELLVERIAELEGILATAEGMWKERDRKIERLEEALAQAVDCTEPAEVKVRRLGERIAAQRQSLASLHRQIEHHRQLEDELLAAREHAERGWLLVSLQRRVLDLAFAIFEQTRKPKPTGAVRWCPDCRTKQPYVLGDRWQCVGCKAEWFRGQAPPVFDAPRRRCPKREGDGKNGAQCEKDEGHDPPCACPEAIEAYRRARFPEVPQ